MRVLLASLFLSCAACVSSSQPCCSMPLSFNLPCGLCGGGGGGGTQAASTPLVVSRGEAPPAPANDSDDESLRRRASFELECDATKLELVTLDSKTKGVRGCGKRATYVKDCSSGACDWLPTPQG